MQALDELSANVHLLLDRYEALQEENARLREDIARQREEMIRTHAELVELQAQNKRLATVGVMSSAEGNELALKRINALIAQVDRAIAALNR
jgi:predicted nuclease with TOPRIM domain